MRDVQKLRELLERVENATGPDADLDHLIASEFSELRKAWACAGKPFGVSYPCYSSSLDASMALVERMLPGWGVGFDKRAEFRPIAWVRPNDQRSGADDFRPAATAPLGILSALLRALISQAEGEGE